MDDDTLLSACCDQVSRLFAKVSGFLGPGRFFHRYQGQSSDTIFGDVIIMHVNMLFLRMGLRGGNSRTHSVTCRILCLTAKTWLTLFESVRSFNRSCAVNRN